MITGLVGFATLTLHGAHYVAMKTEGEVNRRAHGVSRLAWIAVLLLTVVSLIATLSIRPEVLDNFHAHPWGWIIPVIVALSLIAVLVYERQGKEMHAFLASCTYIVSMLGGAAFAVWPNLLTSSTNPEYSLTIFNAKTGAYSMRVGLIWWLVGMALAFGYFTFVYRSFRGKVTLEEDGGY